MATGRGKGGGDVEGYLVGLSEEQRAALEKLRATIRAAAPEAEECISYGVPAFRQNGVLVGYGARPGHCAFYLMSGSTVSAHQEELRDYDTSKGTIRFTPERPLPDALVTMLVRARLAENGA